jgi:hypothetical protein
MSDRRLSKALDRCLRSLQAGASVEEALKPFPELRNELRPLLEAALRLRPVPLEMAEEARDFYRRRMLAEILASRPAAARRAPRFSLPRLLLVPSLAVALVAALLFSLDTTQEPERAEAATLLTVLHGSVIVETSAGVVVGENGMQLRSGDRIVTDADARAVLTFLDGSTVTLEAGTAVAILSVVERQGQVEVKLRQMEGETWTHAPLALGPSQIEIETPTVSVVARDGSFTTAIDKSGRTHVGAQAGAIELRSGDQRSAVKSGEMAIIGAPGVVRAAVQEAPPRELVISVRGAVHVYLTDPSQATVGTIPPGVPVNQVTGARATVEDDTLVIRLPEPRPGSYRLGLRSSTGGEVEIVATIASGQLEDMIKIDVSAEEDWGVGFLLQDNLLSFTRAALLDSRPNVAVTERSVERVLGTGSSRPTEPAASPAGRPPSPVVTRTARPEATVTATVAERTPPSPSPTPSVTPTPPPDERPTPVRTPAPAP